MNIDVSLARWAEQATAEVLLCRDLGHSWNPHDAIYDRERRAYRRILQCARCETRRAQWVGIDGTLSGNTYSYRVGYAVPDGHGRLTASDRGALRLINMGV